MTKSLSMSSTRQLSVAEDVFMACFCVPQRFPQKKNVSTIVDNTGCCGSTVRTISLGTAETTTTEAENAAQPSGRLFRRCPTTPKPGKRPKLYSMNWNSIHGGIFAEEHLVASSFGYYGISTLRGCHWLLLFRNVLEFSGVGMRAWWCDRRPRMHDQKWPYLQHESTVILPVLLFFAQRRWRFVKNFKSRVPINGSKVPTIYTALKLSLST